MHGARGPLTPRPPATPEFAHVTPGGPSHTYPSDGCERVTKLAVGPYDNNVYVVRCTGAREAVVIDGSAGPERILPELEGFTPKAILLTHAHPDHVQALVDLAGVTGVPVLAHPAEAALVPLAIDPIAGGAAVPVGSLELQVLHTPGHTPGSLCFLLAGHLFSGDTLFPGGPGNTFGNPRAFDDIMGSLGRLFELPGSTRVSPGHGLDTTIARERPFLDTWVRRGW
ncbi:MAG: MBL fold metallo-hydrolase [Acidobacteria bacterium]|nr:MBL fold metallo-hydrolase [Acidobacteriota bacterium]